MKDTFTSVWGCFVGGSHYAARDGHTPLMAADANRVFDRIDDFHRPEAGLFDTGLFDRAFR